LPIISWNANPRINPIMPAPASNDDTAWLRSSMFNAIKKPIKITMS
jgi:hypothetical protein